MIEGSMPGNIKNLCGELGEGVDVSGAMVCDYGTFRSLYNHVIRATVRNKMESVIAMLRIIDTGEPDNEISKNITNRIGSAIADSLRRDDVVTGFDTDQFLILLTHLNIDDAKIVLERIISNITDEFGKPVKIETSIEPIKPET